MLDIREKQLLKHSNQNNRTNEAVPATDNQPSQSSVNPHQLPQEPGRKAQTSNKSKISFKELKSLSQFVPDETCDD